MTVFIVIIFFAVIILFNSFVGNLIFISAMANSHA